MKKYKAGFVALLGVPNAGKSTLANTLVGEKFSIVTRKAQTTRKRHQGIVNTDSSQIILVDAPGIIESDHGINAFIKEECNDILAQSDGILVVLNLDEFSPENADKMVQLAIETRKPFAVAMTKADLNLHHRISILEGRIKDLCERAGVAMVPIQAVSAHTAPQAARDMLIPILENLVPESDEKLFGDSDLYTTQTLREMTAEWIREKCFEFIHQEIPYGLAIHIRKFDEDDGPVVKISADIIVERTTHKKIVIGEGGHSIKMIGTAARQELEKLLGRKIFLELHVAVKPKWVKNKTALKELGYVIPKA